MNAYLGVGKLTLDVCGWVAGLIENITNSAKLKLELELSLAIFWSFLGGSIPALYVSFPGVAPWVHAC